MFARSIKVSGWQPGAPKIPGARFSEKKCPDFLKFIEPVTARWVLQSSQIMHVVSAESLLARAVFARSIKVLGWQSGAPKIPGARFSEKNVLIF